MLVLDVNEAEAGKGAQLLAQNIKRHAPDTEIQFETIDDHRQDFGTVLVAILATEAAVQVAIGIRDWLVGCRGRIEFLDGQKSVIVEDVSPETIVEIVCKLLGTEHHE